MKIEDNFLDQDEFKEIQGSFLGKEIPWHYSDTVVYGKDDSGKIKGVRKDGNFQFVHMFYTQHAPISPYLEKLNPILEKIRPTAIYRIKANLITSTIEPVKHDFHVDIGNYDNPERETIYPEKLKIFTTSIFYLNTNDGFTELEDGTIINSVENRFVTFPANIKHRGTSCTDKNIRMVINFNYIK